ncbi:hypothetical protein FJT64_011844 [Amphibalanus amphitrite]|uniref:Uncharacterized protein n=1 Tax=Amphibalanus amphitrite TaxID=1232801 RepID=A0A6A4V8D9_AMPAM|nr:hypothetical protein FJT64_011844 [Amphibalanus amphitrite]
MQLISNSTANCLRHFLTYAEADFTEEARVIELFDKCGVSPLRRPGTVGRDPEVELKEGTDASADPNDMPSELDQLAELQEEAADAVPPEVAADLETFSEARASGIET